MSFDKNSCCRFLRWWWLTDRLENETGYLKQAKAESIDGLGEVGNQERGWSRAFEELWRVGWRVVEEKRRRERQRGRRTGGGNVCLGLVPTDLLGLVPTVLALNQIMKQLVPRVLAGNQIIRVPAWNWMINVLWVLAREEMINVDEAGKRIRNHCWRTLLLAPGSLAATLVPRNHLAATLIPRIHLLATWPPGSCLVATWLQPFSSHSYPHSSVQLWEVRIFKFCVQFIILTKGKQPKGSKIQNSYDHGTTVVGSPQVGGEEARPNYFRDIFQIDSQCRTRKRNNQNWESNGLLTNGPRLWAKRDIFFLSRLCRFRHALKTPFSSGSKKCRAPLQSLQLPTFHRDDFRPLIHPSSSMSQNISS